jgi:AraC-like DNA-binding protein
VSTATSLVRAVVAGAAQQGMAAGALLEGAGISPQTLADRDARIPTSAYLEVFAAASGRCPDLGPAVASCLDGAAFGLLGFVVASCSTMREGLGRFGRYSRLLCDELKVDLVERGDEVAIVYSLDAAPYVPALFEMALTHLVSTSRRGTRGLFRPRRVVFRHPHGARGLPELLRAPVEFGGIEDAAYCDRNTLDLPLRGANPTLLGILESHAAQVLGALPAEDDTIARVRAAIRALLPHGEPSLEAVASRLGVGARTLQRRLRDHEWTFRGLIDEVRRECALIHLANPEVSVAEVAFSLGFSSPSAFHHAFRRWTGRSPGRRA